MNVFNSYARYYDLLYCDKDYQGEANYVAAHIRKHAGGAKRILELGCGTGAHAANLARMGFTVHGVDMSETMLTWAEARKESLPPEIAAQMSFSIGDVRTICTGNVYDAVISLFHVMSYQIKDSDLESAFKTAALHLVPSGLFLFDVWYGPAVLTQIPQVRIKRLEDSRIKVTRIAEPVLHVNDNVVDVNFSVLIEEKETGSVEQLKETHNMRYLFKPEIKRMLSNAGFSLIHGEEWLTGSDPGIDTWGVFFIAGKE